jgi:hypothetical protein
MVAVGLLLAPLARANDYASDPFDPAIARDVWQMISRAEKDYGIPTGLLHAMSLVETGQGIRGWVLPWPYTVGVNSSGTYTAKTSKDALEHLISRRALGFVRFDVSVNGVYQSKLKGEAAAALLGKNPTATNIRITPQPFGRRFNNASEATTFVNRMFGQGYRNMDIGMMQINYRVHGNKFANVSSMFEPNTNVRYAVTYLLEHRQSRDWWGSVGRYHSGTAVYANKYIKNVYNMYKRIHRIDGRMATSSGRAQAS